MKLYIDELIKIIESNLDKQDASFIRVDHFSDPTIYLKVGTYFKEKYPDVIVQLSLERYLEFDQIQHRASLEEIKLKGLVSDNTRLTKWRNTFAEEKKTVILLGTESVQDKGGLSDFYSITPIDIEKNVAGKYSLFFNDIIHVDDKKANSIINNLFVSIFKHLPEDLILVSRIGEDVTAEELLDEEEIVKYILGNMWVYFGLPNIKTVDTSIISNLSRNSIFKLLDSSISFIKRDEYRNGFSTSKERKLNEKFLHFQSEKQEIYEEFINDIKEKFGSYEKFQKIILDYAKGINIDLLRKELSEFDYYIISQILGVKIKKEKETNTITKVKGNPLISYTEMIMDYLVKTKKEYEPLINKTLYINVNKISLAEGILDEDKHQRWQELCIALGGLVEYLNVELENIISIDYKEKKEVFYRENTDDSRIIFTSTQVKVSKISFTLEIEGEKKIDYEWTFGPYDYFLQSFSYLSIIEEQLLNSDKPIVPLFSINQLGNLLTSTDTLSFHYMLKSYEIEMKNALVLLTKLENNSTILFPKLLRLADPFLKFVKILNEKGFYSAINIRKNDVSTQYIQKYKDVITETYKAISQMSRIEKDHLYLVSNLFSILPNEFVYATVGEIDGAIIPPYHPAMFEKIVAQQAFQRKGITESIESFLNNAIEPKILKYKIEKIKKQSTIISGVDTILSKDSLDRFPSQVLGYYALHGQNSKNTIIDSSSLIDSSTMGNTENTEDNLESISSKSILIKEYIQQYVKTFPSNIDGLSICIVNFEHLEAVIEGMKEFINLHKASIRGVNLKLQILSSKNTYKSKNYIRYWLEKNFSEDDNVNIQAYFNEINSKDLTSIKNSFVGNNFDLIFVENILETQDIVYEPTGEKMISPGETKFPMVFHPIPTRKDENVRNISVSQKQFEASFAHSQLSYWIEYPNSINEIYRVEKVLGLKPNAKEMFDIFHNHAHWVVSIDTGLDKAVFDKGNIISFSTGEGSFGELNVAISASEVMKEDIILRLTKRLKTIFSYWEMETCQKSAEYCLDQSNLLDGIKVLKALNPKDYEIHSFLASILAMKSLKVDNFNEETILKSFISLDSYNHWFTGEPNRPDFLLLEIDRAGLTNSKLKINVNLVECKMGKENIIHVEKGQEQLRNGYKFLSKVFDPESIQYDRRYWYAQLYRLIAFSPIYITSNESEKALLNTNLLKILDGDFEIQWNKTLLTYWLDHNGEIVKDEEIDSDNQINSLRHLSFGQLYIQSILLPQNEQNNIEFVDPLSEEFLTFADDEESYKEISEDIKEQLILNDDQTITPILVDINQHKEVESPENESIKNQITKTESIQEFEKKEEKPIIIDYDNIEDVTSENKNNLELESIRILLGEEIRTKRKVYWEYGHPQLENRHILISGKSGVGKTYFMQCLLLELAQNNISSIIFDYTDGFKKSKLEPEFKESLGDRISQFHVQRTGFPINPFKKNMKEIDEDEFMEETNIDVAERIKSVFSAVYKGMGDQQANAIYRATLNGLKKYGNKMSLKYLKNELETDNSSNAKTVLAKIEPLIDREPFNIEETYDWEKHRTKEGIVFVVQLSGFVREVQLIVTEFILWDLWNFNLSHGDKSKPFPVILDEAQNLDHSEKSPSAKILTEGRKFGWSGWYATQFMQGQMAKDEIRRMQMASQKVYFSPPEAEINDMASFLSTDSIERREWANKLSKIGKGQCIVSGPMLRENNELHYTKPMIIDVTPLEKRI